MTIKDLKQLGLTALKKFGPHVLCVGGYVAYVLIMFAIMRKLGVLYGS